MRVFKNSRFEKFARKERISDRSLAEAIRRAQRELVDADLGGGMITQRVARDGSGKSGGYRTIIIFRSGERAVFVFGFAKSDKANLNSQELSLFKKAATLVLAFSNEQIDEEVVAGRLMEVQFDGQDIQE